MASPSIGLATSPSFRRRLTLILGILAAVGPFSIDMYLPAFPLLAQSLGTSVAAVQLTLATYLAGLAVGQIVYGPLADRLGRRLPLLVGLAVYIVASFACAAATSLEVLAAARFVQALGASAGMVISRAVVRDHFDERESAGIYSSLMLVMGAAPILAPLIGGQLAPFAGWRSLFFALAAIGAAMFAMVYAALPESLSAEARSRSGALQTVRAMGGIVRNVRFLRFTLAGGAIQAAMFAYISGSPFVFIEIFGVDPKHYGLLFGANAVGLIAASQLNRWLIPRIGTLRALRGGIVVATGAFAGVFAASGPGASLAVVAPLIFVGIASVGLVLPNATASAMAPFGKDAGLASAVLGTLQTACGALAAVAVSLLSNGTAGPMAIVMLASAGVALAAVLPVAASREPVTA